MPFCLTVGTVSIVVCYVSINIVEILIADRKTYSSHLVVLRGVAVALV